VKPSYDIFVSYSSLNGTFVHEELVPRLAECGFSVLTDRDFELGQPIVHNIETGIRVSKHTILVITQEWLESVWCDFESLLIQTLDPSARHGRVIPLLRAPVKMPATLAPLTYLNLLPGTNLEEGFDRLIQHLAASLRPANTSQRFTTSKTGVDYTRLAQLLAAREWHEADRETAQVMVRACGRTPGWGEGLTAQELEVFPCADLHVIDELWMTHSRRQFGFTAQRNQYLSAGSDRVRFGDAIGWRSNSFWIAYTDVRFDLTAPIGHLPIGGFRGGLRFLDAYTMSQGVPGFASSQLEVAKSALGDLLTRGGGRRFLRRLKAEVTLKNGFALWWVEARIALINRLAFCRNEALTSLSA
jgi:GUN4-like protein/TIR domain-containing protein